MEFIHDSSPYVSKKRRRLTFHSFTKYNYIKNIRILKLKVRLHKVPNILQLKHKDTIILEFEYNMKQNDLDIIG